jgi:drug/metabolite transporter (DMT)-like permease
MEPQLILMLLGAAALHAAWNAILRAAPEQRREVVSIAVAAAIMAAFALPFLHAPAPSSLPYLVASSVLQLFYFELLGTIYQHAELSYAYPLMRGGAPLMTAAAGAFMVGERLSASSWSGIALICSGVVLLGMEGVRAGSLNARILSFGLVNAAIIAAYTLVDGIGIRISGAPWGYAAWLFLVNGVLLYWRGRVVVAWRFGGALSVRGHWIVFCGACMLSSYSIALWAMTRAPLGAVAALRETSVLFATLFAAVLLNERLSGPRYVAAALVTVGAIAIKLG